MLQKNCKKCCVVAIGSYIEWAFSNKVAEDWHVRLRCRQGGRHIDEANQSNVEENCKKCCVVAIGSYIEWAFSNKVAEDWHVGLGGWRLEGSSDQNPQQHALKLKKVT
jgi:hypothetical protein